MGIGLGVLVSRGGFVLRACEDWGFSVGVGVDVGVGVGVCACIEGCMCGNQF